jgi:FAD dependent oxidoreductase TIGR03364
MRNTTVRAIEAPTLHTSGGQIQAERIAVCPGDDLTGLYAERLRRFGLTRCKLQMLRLADPGFKLPASLMSDLGLARYAGYAALGPAVALKARLSREQPGHVEHGVHLIVVQGADGSLVVGDSHHYAPTPDPFGRAEVDALILDEFQAALGITPPAVLERWIGTYASAPDKAAFIDTPDAAVRLAIVTSGAGASTGFAMGEEVVASLFNTGTTTP